MNCRTCDHEAIPYDSDIGQIGDTFHTVSWELVNPIEYKERVADGRTTKMSVCPKCYVKYTGLEYLTIDETLRKLDKKREHEDN